MARLISDEDEFIQKYLKSEYNDLLLKLVLSQDEAKRWKENQNFKHIRNQLRQVDGLEIACQTFISPSGKHMCHYYFMCPTRKMMGRVYHMILEVFDHGNHIKLTDAEPVPPEPGSGYNHTTAMKASMNPSCALI